MVFHTYQIHLDSDVIRLPNVDDLLGKDVEVTVRELKPDNSPSNFDALNHLLTNKASPHFFRDINDPVVWQKQVRDEWE